MRMHRQRRLEAVGMDGDEILVTHRHDRQLEPDALGDVIRVGTGGVDHHVAVDRPAIGFDAGDAAVLDARPS